LQPTPRKGDVKSKQFKLLCKTKKFEDKQLLNTNKEEAIIAAMTL
jgi:hypothetical protein